MTNVPDDRSMGEKPMRVTLLSWWQRRRWYLFGETRWAAVLTTEEERSCFRVAANYIARRTPALAVSQAMMVSINHRPT